MARSLSTPERPQLHREIIELLRQRGNRVLGIKEIHERLDEAAIADGHRLAGRRALPQRDREVREIDAADDPAAAVAGHDDVVAALQGRDAVDAQQEAGRIERDAAKVVDSCSS